MSDPYRFFLIKRRDHCYSISLNPFYSKISYIYNTQKSNQSTHFQVKHKFCGSYDPFFTMNRATVMHFISDHIVVSKH